MNKPTDLRNYLLDNIQELAQQPQNLNIRIEKGYNRFFAKSLEDGAGRFIAEYDVQVLIDNYAGDPAELFVCINAWCIENEAKLLFNQEKSHFSYEIEWLDNKTQALLFSISLSEGCDFHRAENGQLVFAWTPTKTSAIRADTLGFS